jgi:hypothetical protein
MKNKAIFAIAAPTILLFAMICQAEVKTTTSHNGNESATLDFKFRNALQPSRNDTATKATFAIVDGRRDRNGVKYLDYVLGSDDFKQRVAKSKFHRMPLFAKSDIGYIALQGDHGQVSFRNIKIRPIR